MTALESSVMMEFIYLFFFTGRARVAGGLPDVVTIQEGKVNKFFPFSVASTTSFLF